ncbi:MAG: alpha/beta hydrolase-fold protein [Pirellulaceae bacterium]
MAQEASAPCSPIERKVPPLGIDIPPTQWSDWMSQIRSLDIQVEELEPAQRPDVEVLLKACRYAIEFHELYKESDFEKVDRLLALAADRIAAAKNASAGGRTDESGIKKSEVQSDGGASGHIGGPTDESSIKKSEMQSDGGASGHIGDPTSKSHAKKNSAGVERQVRGFRSRVDGSAQPLGLVLPDGWQQVAQPMPLYVWLHGRGDKETDLHFICQRLDSVGQIQPPGAIVLHPFGRQCIGYKSAGETDVMEAIDFVCENYPVDPRRIVLMGFSMGGAGAWHLGAHYGERFVAVSPGSWLCGNGALYQNLAPADFPPKYEQLLWGVYDVPGYTRSLFNQPLVAYSGEVDKQIQAARVMEEAFVAEGRELKHLIGPGMGHKYHPDSLAELLRLMDEAVQQGKPTDPTELFIQTRHPRYARRSWLTIDGPIDQYADCRATAVRSDGRWAIETAGAARLTLDASVGNAPQGAVTVDGTSIAVNLSGETFLERQPDGAWQRVEQFPSLRKHPGLSGPIDDAFIDPFLVVLPTGQSGSAQVAQWVECESVHFADRWKSLFRGRLRVKRDVDVTEQDMADYHLLLWGDPHSSQLISRVFEAWGTEPTTASRLGESPQGDIAWTSEALQVGPQSFDSASHVLLAIRPNPLSGNSKYVVFNSGPTFRQAHDRTNSLQNPHLPDWAVISLATPPSAESPGEVAAAGFFDNAWQFDPNLMWPAAPRR